jgi:methionine aminopeptidase
VGEKKETTIEEIDLIGFSRAQKLAENGVREISSLMREGWTELQTAALLDTYLKDYGVKSFFHHAFAWFGERTRFDGIKKYVDFLPGQRVLLPGEVYILDVAPIYQGYICDVGFTACLGSNTQYIKAEKKLVEIREEIPTLFMGNISLGEIWKTIGSKIKEAGYDLVHTKYPFEVVGHRVYKTLTPTFGPKWLGFGWQSYWELVSRGISRELIAPQSEGDKRGLWAIEPHLGTKEWGAKFEEILVVETDRAY